MAVRGKEESGGRKRRSREQEERRRLLRKNSFISHSVTSARQIAGEERRGKGIKLRGANEGKGRERNGGHSEAARV